MSERPTPTVTLLHGDCLAVMREMPGGSVDCVITDPPYGINTRTAYKSNRRGNLTVCNDFAPVYGDDKPFDPSPWLKFPRAVLFGANHYCSRLPDSPCWLVWDKRDGIPPNDNADCEMAWTNLKAPARLLHHRWNGMIKASERTERRVHPTQKPVALMEWVIRQCKLPQGATILDPYMGSGSTGIAAVNLGYSFIGIEINESYFNIARARIGAAQAQQRMEMVV